MSSNELPQRAVERLLDLVADGGVLVLSGAGLSTESPTLPLTNVACSMESRDLLNMCIEIVT